MNLWHNVNRERINPNKFLACIEISKGSKCKYELDKETGALRLDRVLYTSTIYPHNYGFIPKTLSEDRDPLDVLVLCSEPIISLALMEAVPIGVLMMTDSGEQDEKIIAVAASDPFYSCYKDITELPAHILEEISHFFKVYKELEDKETIIESFYDAKVAKKIICECLERYKEKFHDMF
ncbi:MAG: inorganic diphosphatase [Bacilli bacterium]